MLDLRLVILFMFARTALQDSCENVIMPSNITLRNNSDNLAIEGLNCDETISKQKYGFHFTCLSEWCKEMKWKEEVLTNALGPSDCIFQLPKELMSFTEYKLEVHSENCTKTYHTFKTPPSRPLQVTNVEIICAREETLGLKFEKPYRPTGNLLEFKIVYDCGQDEVKSTTLRGDLGEKHEICLRDLPHRGACQITIFAMNNDVKSKGEPYTFPLRLHKDLSKNNYCEICDGQMMPELLIQMERNSNFNDVLNRTCSNKQCYMNILYENSKNGLVPYPCDCRDYSQFVNCMISCKETSILTYYNVRFFFLLVGQYKITEDQAIEIFQRHQSNVRPCRELSEFIINEETFISQHQMLLLVRNTVDLTQWVCSSNDQENREENADSNFISDVPCKMLIIMCTKIVLLMYGNMIFLYK